VIFNIYGKYRENLTCSLEKSQTNERNEQNNKRTSMITTPP